MNYLLLGFDSTLLNYIKNEIEKNSNDHAIYLNYYLNKSMYEGALSAYKIDKVIVSEFQYNKITNSSVDIRYLENYRFIIDICARNNIKHLHIIENASKIYNGFIKPSRDYKYKEDDDIYSNDLESLNHLFIRKYAEHISSTTSLVITISRYNKLLYPNWFVESLIKKADKNEEFEYVEDNKIDSYTDLVSLTSSILNLCNQNEGGVYNLPVSATFTKTELVEYIIKSSNLINPRIKVQQLRNMPESYILDDSKIKRLNEKVSNK